MRSGTFDSIKSRIIEVGVSEVARRTGLARSVIHNFAHGRSSINSDNLEKIVDALYCEITVSVPPVKGLLENVHCDPKKADQILVIAKILKNLYRPKKIIIFGSQARGDWRKDSDVDFLVIGFDEKVEGGQYQIEAFNAGIDISFDVILATESRIKQHMNEKSSVYSKAMKDGIEINV